MKTLAIIGASYLQRPLAEKAHEMGSRGQKELCARIYAMCFFPFR